MHLHTHTLTHSLTCHVPMQLQTYTCTHSFTHLYPCTYTLIHSLIHLPIPLHPPALANVPLDLSHVDSPFGVATAVPAVDNAAYDPPRAGGATAKTATGSQPTNKGKKAGAAAGPGSPRGGQTENVFFSAPPTTGIGQKQTQHKAPKAANGGTKAQKTITVGRGPSSDTECVTPSGKTHFVCDA
jgi:hypothetical protein